MLVDREKQLTRGLQERDGCVFLRTVLQLIAREDHELIALKGHPRRLGRRLISLAGRRSPSGSVVFVHAACRQIFFVVGLHNDDRRIATWDAVTDLKLVGEGSVVAGDRLGPRWIRARRVEPIVQPAGNPIAGIHRAFLEPVIEVEGIVKSDSDRQYGDQ